MTWLAFLVLMLLLGAYTSSCLKVYHGQKQSNIDNQSNMREKHRFLGLAKNRHVSSISLVQRTPEVHENQNNQSIKGE